MTLYTVLCSYAVFVSNYIYGKLLLTLILSLLLFHFCKSKIQWCKCFIYLCCSWYNPYFIVFLYPFLPQKYGLERVIFLNTILLRFILENSYYLGFDYTTVFYYIWGFPIILLSILVSFCFKRYSSFCLAAISLLVITGQIIFNYKLESKKIYTLSDSNDIVANYKILKDYQPKIGKASIDELEYKKNIFSIFSLAENKDLIKENYIKSDNVYLLLAEHDNLNNFLDQYPYFNNDSHQNYTPWNLYKPNFIMPFKYITDKDIFYSSNIGASVKIGHPIVWSYSFLGKPIILASLSNINRSKVFLWGDSDFMVNKLIPYNSLLTEKILGRHFFLFYAFAISYIILILCYLTFENNKFYLLFCLYVFVLYMFPITSVAKTVITLYPQFPFYTAHNEASFSSYLNIFARNNISIKISNKKNSNVWILTNTNNSIAKYNHVKLIYLISGASVSLNKTVFTCSNIKIGTDNKNKVVDARYLIINDKIINASIYKNEAFTIICTGSPQLNTSFAQRIVVE